jgi:hypothetical protein
LRDEDWESAEYFADSKNKEVLTVTDFYPTFVKKVKTYPMYISKRRNEKLNDIGI